VTGTAWTASDRYPFARWQGDLPAPRTAADMERLLGVLRAVLAAGRQEGVWQVLETPAPEPYRAEVDGPFEDLAARHLAATGELRLLDLERGAVAPPRGRLRTPSRIAFRGSDGAVTEADVDDAGELLRTLRPDAPEPTGDGLAHVPPLALHGTTVRLGDGRRPRLVVELPASVWFPRVLDLAATVPRWHDNTEVAAHNAPRLNRFLAAVRAAVEDAGGSWSLVDEGLVEPAYADQLDRDGIVLDT
jgi:hypothetical protein